MTKGKLNIGWGRGIVLLYLSFVALILTLVFKSMKQQVDLVSPDYYDREIAYQQHINSMQRAKMLGSTSSIKVEKEQLTLAMSPKVAGEAQEGSVYFYCPANAGHDKKFSLILTSLGVQHFPLSEFEPGKYKVEINWKMKGENYSEELMIYIH